MRVAGVIPCHQHARWVGDCVRGMAGQSVRPDFIVVVDDGSTDGSAEAAEEAGAGCGVPVEIVRSAEARGPSAARNAGIRAAGDRADVLAFCDADDFYLPGKIELSLRLFRPGVAMVYSDYETANPEGLVLRQYKEPYSRERLLRECLANSDSLISVTAFRECGLFDEELRTVEDYDRWLAFSERFMLVHLPEPLVRIRVGPHSSSATVPTEQWKANYARVMQKVQDRARRT